VVKVLLLTTIKKIATLAIYSLALTALFINNVVGQKNDRYLNA
jgi:hypothetical protein